MAKVTNFPTLFFDADGITLENMVSAYVEKMGFESFHYVAAAVMERADDVGDVEADNCFVRVWFSPEGSPNDDTESEYRDRYDDLTPDPLLLRDLHQASGLIEHIYQNFHTVENDVVRNSISDLKALIDNLCRRTLP